ncbi:DNA-directed RNA polymerase subunit omega [Virgibacillus halodenitrificans]|jgi:DNA-directed RNA polymerase subunit omega|uniref:DNA-directed RNA polymerase subunit omega n=1 Tax=Virgibacillus halodenitrificans TaxID=1482 RepID=A0AAC9NL71_VIRHA|nr:DNA-directed RNA polymerase subunit omega [Virgibacillus halodenitrificans]APC48685.1 DNA-directed RNA polymerase subunit omega [Virgibacillus halodenitrificans]MBD1224483.1 DNA-directed RNA polymerase subunit omega [Virgibacillus halodenitrificans]MCG1028645.1 DNA-directed RNA polymerase subunit omega [Virgibacillus halodenitrificans]MCJ0931261.1 DNA-directed RNA polymerase subunit omega [Virgibacillus halodenitrificans]MYL45907.1 DNA-directed RNA polymerase subunit omega [Virgibacillus ha
MLEPSIDALQEKINSKYTLVTLSAMRARQMSETKNPLVDHPFSHKYVGMALEEILAEKLTIADGQKKDSE